MKNLFIQSSVLPEENKERDIEAREKHTNTHNPNGILPSHMTLTFKVVELTCMKNCMEQQTTYSICTCMSCGNVALQMHLHMG
jgi:hypothetical protein